MAKIRIKTNKVDIKIADIKPNEFTGAWKWVLDVLETMNASEDKVVEDKMDNVPFDLFMSESFEIINTARTVLCDMYTDIVGTMPLEDAQRYNVCGDGKKTFDSICDDFVMARQSYTPNEAAKLTGRICSRFFYEQASK